MLVSFASLVEMLNSVYNPINLNLDGYSKSIMMSAKDYDEIFEELYYKWSDRTYISPELKLVMALAGSTMFFHTGSLRSKQIKKTKKKTKQKKKSNDSDSDSDSDSDTDSDSDSDVSSASESEKNNFRNSVPMKMNQDLFSNLGMAASLFMK